MSNGNNLRNGGKGARGGKRKGAGRKKAAYTLLQEKMVEERGNEALRSFDLLVQIRDNPDEPTAIRKECALAIMDRIWGKPKETFTHNLPNASVLTIITHGEPASGSQQPSPA